MSSPVVRTFSDASAFLDLPEDYKSELFEHRLLITLPAVTKSLYTLAQYSEPAAESSPLPLAITQKCFESLESLSPWRRQMFHALTTFYRDTFEHSTFRNITTGSSSKVKVLRALFAVRCYTILVKQIEELKKAMIASTGLVEGGGMSLMWLAGWTDLKTVEVRMERFIMEGVKPVDEDLLLENTGETVQLVHDS